MRKNTSISKRFTDEATKGDLGTRLDLYIDTSPTKKANNAATGKIGK